MSNLAENHEEQQPAADTAVVLYQSMLGITVSNQETYGLMAEVVKRAKEGKKSVEAWFKPMKESAQKAHKDICAREKEMLEPYSEIETTGQSEMNRWLNEEKKRKDEEERKLREEAAAKAKEEEERLKQSAAALESLGDATTAAKLREDAERVIAAPVITNAMDRTVRTGGATVSAKTETVVQVTDRKAFLRYLVEKNSEAAFIEFPVRALTNWVKANGLKAGDVPGLAIEERLASAIR